MLVERCSNKFYIKREDLLEHICKYIRVNLSMGVFMVNAYSGEV